MKKIVLLVIGLIFLPLAAIAYQVNIDAPDTLTVGKPLIVTGTTTFGIGTPIDVVLYYQLTTTSEVKRKIAYIQPDKTFKAVFDTTGLKTGTYKVEVPTSGMGGDSVTMRVIQIVDRSDAIRVSSSLSQPFTGKMNVAGTITGGENSGIQIEVVGPENDVIFGPRFVNTNYQGEFAIEVPVNEAGDYEISFTDGKGYIGVRTITIISRTDSAEIPLTEQPTPEVRILSAHAHSTQDMPAYFSVTTGSGPVTLYTSSSVDWVIEYADESGMKHMVNANGVEAAERISLIGKGKTLFIKIYPKSPSVSGEAFLYGQNVKSLVISPQVPAPFAEAAPAPTEEAPLSPIIPVIGIAVAGIAALVVKRKF